MKNLKNILTFATLALLVSGNAIFAMEGEGTETTRKHRMGMGRGGVRHQKGSYKAPAIEHVSVSGVEGAQMTNKFIAIELKHCEDWAKFKKKWMLKKMHEFETKMVHMGNIKQHLIKALAEADNAQKNTVFNEYLAKFYNMHVEHVQHMKKLCDEEHTEGKAIADRHLKEIEFIGNYVGGMSSSTTGLKIKMK